MNENATPNRSASSVTLGLVLAAALCGCAADRPLNIDVPSNVERPTDAVLLIFVDGFGRDAFDRGRAAGDLPNIQQNLLARGVLVDEAFSCIPTITYANSVTFLTGRFPGHHGIISNRWFEPTAGLARDYCTQSTYRLVDLDYTAPTLHQLLASADTVNLQSAQRRGATYTVDNWMTSGINWFFANYSGVDCLVAQDFGEIAAHARARKRWPTFIYAYLPGVDHVGHLCGTQSDAFRRAVRTMDCEIGRMCDALRQAGMYEHTNLVLVSDHGLVPIRRDRVLDVAQFLRDNSGRPVERIQALAASPRLIDTVDAAVAISGSRWLSIYLRRNGNWRERLFTPYGSGPDCDPWLNGKRGSLADHPSVGIVAGRHAPGIVWVRTRRGVSLIRREMDGGRTVYRYDTGPGDALGYLADAELRGAIDAGPMSSRDWLKRSARSAYPDFVPQVAEMFDSPRAGDIVLFASADGNFATDEPAAAHGSVLPAEMRVPMIFAGPDVPPGTAIPFARNCDVMPTILQLLHRVDRLPVSSRIDGVPLLPTHSDAGRSAAP